MLPLAVLATGLLATGCIDTSGLVFGGPGTGTGTGAGAGAPSGTYAATVLDDGPLGYWPLDELVNGNFTPDESGDEWHAFAFNDSIPAELVSGPVGNAISLANGASLVVDGTNHPFGMTTGSFSLEAWVRVDNGGGGNLWTCSPGGMDNVGYTSFVGPTELNIKLYAAGGLNESFALNPVALAEFRHVVYVYDDASGRAQWYLDGAPGGPSQDVPFSWDDPQSPFSLAFGGFSGGGEVLVDEIAAYDRALSAERIEAHYLCGAMQDCN